MPKFEIFLSVPNNILEVDALNWILSKQSKYGLGPLAVSRGQALANNNSLQLYKIEYIGEPEERPNIDKLISDFRAEVSAGKVMIAIYSLLSESE